MKCLGNRKSKRTKLSLKYNIAKRVREHKRRVKKEAKKLGLKKRTKKDPGIPNTWPFKAEMLADLERKKQKRDEEMMQRRAMAKKQAQKERKTREIMSVQEQQQREEERRRRRAEQVEQSQRSALLRVLQKADIFLQVLDARDPNCCRCEEFEAWAQEKGKRVAFVLAKADLVTPQHVAQWLQILGQAGPAVAVQAEAGREGVAELVRMLGHGPPATASTAAPDGKTPAAPAATAPTVGVVGYLGTGKRALCKAIRREVQSYSPAKWLLEAIGRFRPPESAGADASAAAAVVLHQAVRGAMPRASGAKSSSSAAQKDSAAGPLAAAVQHLLERAGPQAVMRRFRLPAFQGVEDLLKAFAKDKDLKTKRGREPALEVVAHRLLSELAVAPGCSCVPPSVAEAGGAQLWAAHGDSKPQLEAIMKAQLEQLRTRDPGPAASAMQLSSRPRGGPAVNLKDLLEELEVPDDDMEGEDEDSDEAEGEEEEEELEGEEEKDEGFEGEEEEEEGNEDGMDDV